MLNHSSPPLDALSPIWHALADPHRRAMIDALSGGQKSVSELAAPLPMSLAGAVQHLQILEQAGLVRTEKKGRVRQCALNRASLALVQRWLDDRIGFWQGQFANLDRFLNQKDKGDDESNI